MKPNSFIVLLLLCFGQILLSCQRGSGTTKLQRKCFERVAAAIDSADAYTAIQEKFIDEYHKSVELAKTTDEAFFYNMKIVDHYVLNNTSKALECQSRCFNLAMSVGDHDKVVESLISKCFIYNAAGYLDVCRKTLDSLMVMTMTPKARMAYYDCEMRYWQNYIVFYNMPLPSTKVNAYADSILHIKTSIPKAMEYHARVWSETNVAKKRNLLDAMVECIDTMPTNDTYYRLLTQDAMILAVEGLNDEETMLAMATKNIDASLRNGDRSILALWYVAMTAVKAGDLDYSEKFMSALSDYNEAFPERVRPPLYKMQHQLSVLLHKRDRKATQVSIACSIVVSLLLLAAIGLIVYARRMSAKRAALHKDLSRQYAIVRDMTTQLQQEQANLMNANDALMRQSQQLKDSNQQLAEANYLKEEYIGRMFALCAEYLHKIEEMKKNINRKLAAGQIELAIKATKPNNDQKELSDLWDRFDEAFLNIFPDFIEKFNELLQPDKRVQLRDAGHLNTELRIYALVRLGINNSVRISQILGLSTQTVYNTRQKMRARALPSDIEFPKRVRALTMSYVADA